MTAIAAPTAALPAAPTPAAGGKASADGFDALLAIAGRSDDTPSPRPTAKRAESKNEDRDVKAADRPARSDAKVAERSDEPRAETNEAVDGVRDAKANDDTNADKASGAEAEAVEADVETPVAADTTLASAQVAATLIAAMSAEPAPTAPTEMSVEPALTTAATSVEDVATFAAAVEAAADATLAAPQMASSSATAPEAAAAPAPQAASAPTTAAAGAQALDAAALDALTTLAGEAETPIDAASLADAPTAPSALAKIAEPPAAAPLAMAANTGALATPPAPSAQVATLVEAGIVADTTPAATDAGADAAADVPAVVTPEVATVVAKSADTTKAQAAPGAAPTALPAAEAVETPEAVTAVAASAGGGDAGVSGDAYANANGSEASAGAIVTPEASAAGASVAEAAPSSTPAPPVQLRAANTATPAAAPAPVRGSPETVAALSAEILKKADAKTTRFDVALTPDGLGKVDVRIEIGRDGALTASMRFDTVHAAQELRGKANELRQALSDAGFNVADNALSFDVSSQGGQSQNPFFAFEGWGDQGQRAFSGRAFQAALTGEEDITITPELLPGLKTVADSGLDIRI
ncbi:hypothetical protein J2X45_002104 [Caulobacter sp. BE264]|nr:hypothetical protein [Caulobacter sp. BE264]